MPLALNEEQRMLRESTQAFLRDNANVGHFRELRDNGPGWVHSTEIWQALVDLGLSGLLVAEEFGGSGFGHLALGAVFEQMGRQLTPAPLLSSCVISASIIQEMGSVTLQQELLPSMVQGELLVVPAVQGGVVGDLQRADASLTDGTNGLRLNGTRRLVMDGLLADKFLVLASNSGEPESFRMVLVEASADGVQRTEARMIDSRCYADLVFTDCPVQELLSDRDAVEVGRAVFDKGSALIAAEMLGIAEELFERTMVYLREREQFGAKIGSFQALQHRAAKLYTELQLTRSAVVDALSALDEQRDDSRAAVSMAKSLANECCRLVASESVQMHGGIGVTDELDIGLYLKRSRVCQNLFGSTGYHNNRFASCHDF